MVWRKHATVTLCIPVSDCRFSDVSISQGNVTTHLRCVGSLITTLLQIFCPVKQWRSFENRLRFHPSYRHEFGVFLVFEHGVERGLRVSVWQQPESFRLAGVRQSIISELIDALSRCENANRSFVSVSRRCCSCCAADWLHGAGDFSAIWRIDHQYKPTRRERWAYVDTPSDAMSKPRAARHSKLTQRPDSVICEQIYRHQINNVRHVSTNVKR